MPIGSTRSSPLAAGPAPLHPKRLHCSIPFLADAIDNPLKHALGDRDNPEFITDPKDAIGHERTWSKPVIVRQNLELLVGKPVKFTKASEQDHALKPLPKSEAAKGFVLRLPLAEFDLHKDGLLDKEEIQKMAGRLIERMRP